MTNTLKIGHKYINDTTIVINYIDKSYVSNVKTGTNIIQNSINILTGNGYSVTKSDIYKYNIKYTISPSGMYAEYCGSDTTGNYVFKLLQPTPVKINETTSDVLPINTKITLSKESSNNSMMFIESNTLIDNSKTNNNIFNKIVEDGYQTINQTINPASVITRGGKHKKINHRSRRTSNSKSKSKSMASTRVKNKRYRNKKTMKR
jgi:hypothetical protein